MNGDIPPDGERRRPRTQRRIAQALALYEEGIPNQAIAERLGVTEERVCHYLRAANVPARNTGGRYPAGYRAEAHAA